MMNNMCRQGKKDLKDLKGGKVRNSSKVVGEGVMKQGTSNLT
jgi:hypothetical protein